MWLYGLVTTLEAEPHLLGGTEGRLDDGRPISHTSHQSPRQHSPTPTVTPRAASRPRLTRTADAGRVGDLRDAVQPPVVEVGWTACAPVRAVRSPGTSCPLSRSGQMMVDEIGDTLMRTVVVNW